MAEGDITVVGGGLTTIELPDGTQAMRVVVLNPDATEVGQVPTHIAAGGGSVAADPDTGAITATSGSGYDITLREIGGGTTEVVSDSSIPADFDLKVTGGRVRLRLEARDNGSGDTEAWLTARLDDFTDISLLHFMADGTVELGDALRPLRLKGDGLAVVTSPGAAAALDSDANGADAPSVTITLGAGGAGDGIGVAGAQGNLLVNLPTADPLVAGALYEDSITHVIKVSQGA